MFPQRNKESVFVPLFKRQVDVIVLLASFPCALSRPLTEAPSTSATCSCKWRNITPLRYLVLRRGHGREPEVPGATASCCNSNLPLTSSIFIAVPSIINIGIGHQSLSSHPILLLLPGHNQSRPSS
ncbi:uncharacterized protein CLUP02_14346 [Colletotrichum lupini]|uniref:Uncharacterized protein n=1 Tax=Colletotrichum lupini TaxID=145971 RepID=A0A9Q8WN75_9PEZI|nr:uncharacterized protein CLUP02_14346 [Colletotrichum lupini]UQC88820.1 hypothetical protein CLUP02_14346 [Colletotrichum lupini]